MTSPIRGRDGEMLVIGDIRWADNSTLLAVWSLATTDPDAPMLRVG